jgi:hypothetical protein
MRFSLFWVAVIAAVAYWLGRQREQKLILAGSPGAMAAQKLTGHNPILDPQPVQAPPPDGVVPMVNPPGSSAWSP